MNWSLLKGSKLITSMNVSEANKLIILGSSSFSLVLINLRYGGMFISHFWLTWVKIILSDLLPSSDGLGTYLLKQSVSMFLDWFLQDLLESVWRYISLTAAHKKKMAGIQTLITIFSKMWLDDPWNIILIWPPTGQLLENNQWNPKLN